MPNNTQSLCRWTKRTRRSDPLGAWTSHRVGHDKRTPLWCRACFTISWSSELAVASSGYGIRLLSDISIASFRHWKYRGFDRNQVFARQAMTRFQFRCGLLQVLCFQLWYACEWRDAVLEDSSRLLHCPIGLRRASALAPASLRLSALDMVDRATEERQTT